MGCREIQHFPSSLPALRKQQQLSHFTPLPCKTVILTFNFPAAPGREEINHNVLKPTVSGGMNFTEVEL